MEQTLRAPFAGVLKAIKCKVGDIVGEGVELAEVEPAISEIGVIKERRTDIDLMHTKGSEP